MLPLLGRRILVTRSRHQASELAAVLAGLGATPILIPTIEVAPPLSFASLDHGVASLRTFHWLIFTSANAVDAFQQRCILHGVERPSDVATAVIGAATARAARAAGLNVVLIPTEAVQEALAEALLRCIRPSTRLLLIRAADARNSLPETLLAAGAEVTIAEAYRTQIPDGSILALREIFAEPGRYPDAITFTSSSTATNLLALLQAAELTLPLDVIRASIGPITSRTLCDLNLTPHLEAPEASIGALARSLGEYFAAAGRLAADISS